ncbi:MAG: hypothetical protein AUI97_06485 [Crenarchaeota archaeon 13_1_40CM_3_52_17]|nr:MAG: hypothetical protein AUI97_06485 [Crenarchaeota archaeon 13_1_40CM_3_52_17]
MTSVALSELLRQGRVIDPNLRLMSVQCPKCRSQDVRLKPHIIVITSEEGREKQIATIACKSCGNWWEDSPENLAVSFERLPPLVSELKGAPEIRDAGISVHIQTNLHLRSQTNAEQVIHCLLDAGGLFIPETFEGDNGRRTLFNASDLTVPLNGWTNGWIVGKDRLPGIMTKRLKPFKVLFNVMTTDFVMFDYLSLYFCLDKNGVLDPKRAKLFDQFVGPAKLVTVAKSLYGAVGANRGDIRNDFHEEPLGTWKKDNARGWNPPKVRHALQGLFWANFFGPEYVDMWGREKMLSAPCYRAEELPDGGVILQLSASPFDASKPEYADTKQRLYDYLGEDAFTGKTLPKFRIGEGRKKRDARPLRETGGVRDNIFN